MHGREAVVAVTVVVVAVAVTGQAVRLLRLRRLLGPAGAPDDRRARRVLDVLTAAYAVIVGASVAAGALLRSVTWGVGVAVVLSVAAMLVAVLAMVLGVLLPAVLSALRRR
jgi:hypothetical protein